MSHSVLMQTYLEHKLELLRFLSKRLDSPSLAADLVQDLYLKLRGIKECPPIRDHRAYLFSMAANLATDHIRVEKRRGEILEEAQAVVWPQANELTPERHALARAEFDCLRVEIERLSPRGRQIFYLTRYEGKSQAEIAAQLGIGITTIYKDMKAVMSALLEARRQFHDPAPDDRESAGQKSELD